MLFYIIYYRVAVGVEFLFLSHPIPTGFLWEFSFGSPYGYPMTMTVRVAVGVEFLFPFPWIWGIIGDPHKIPIPTATLSEYRHFTKSRELLTSKHKNTKVDLFFQF